MGISVCYITKNEEKWIGESIQHLRPLVHEFVLMDTGSTDRTVEIAKEAGANVFQMEWPDDFSAARNASLSKATQDWILKIDPDERLDSKDFSLIRGLTATNAVAYQFYTRAYTNDPEAINLHSYRLCEGEYPQWEKDFKGYIVYPSIRLFRRLPGVEYRGKIHESVEQSLPGWTPEHSPVQTSEVPPFHHYGHNFEARSEKNKDSLYFRLLNEEANANPKNWYVQFELGIDAFKKGNYSEAVEFFMKADAAHPRKPQVLSNLGYALVLSGRREEGEFVLRKCLEVDSKYHDAWLNLGVSRLEAHDFATALDHLENALHLRNDSPMALRAAGQALAQLKRFVEAEACFQRAIETLPHFTEAKIDLAILWQTMGKTSKAKHYISEILREFPNHPRARRLSDAWA